MLSWTVQRVLGMALGRAPGAAAALVLAVFGCSFPSPEACALQCGEDDACPGGFECQASSQLCVPRGMVAPCEPLQVVNPIEPWQDGRDDAGLGGSGPGVVESDAAAGGSPAGRGGESGAAGTAGDPTPAVLSIVPVGAAEGSACTGVALGGALRASGGEGPYAWRVLEAPPGTDRSSASGDELVLGGVPSEPGIVVVELEDATGASAHAELVVYARPEVALDALPAMCAGEGYSVELSASGGERDDYVWSAELASDDGESPTLDQLGLHVDGSRLTGEVVAGRDDAPLRLLVDVRDAHCRSSRTELELEVFSSESDECPTIEIVDPPALDELPPPCLGNLYSEQLTVVGGAEPYVWSEVSAPPGLDFDADTGSIEGIARGDGVLTVEVTDANSRTVQKSYDITTRDNCWLAFVASEPAPARLALVDARLLERQPEAARRSLPEDAGPDPVIDFQFSPDGRFIAYRLGADPSTRRLELARLSNGRAEPISTGGAVTAYAWSSDASTLALLLGEGAQSRLGGVDVSRVDALALEPETTLDGMRSLTPVVVPPLDSTLSWYADGRLAFLSRAPGAERRLVTALLGANRFASPSTRAGVAFSSAAGLLAGAGGVFVAEPATGVHEFFADGVDAPVPHADGVVISPSGAFAGAARGGRAQIFRPERSSAAAGAPPSFEANGCTTLLAWASDRERIACADARGGDDRIVWFDISANGDALGELALLRDAYAYPSAERVGHRRTFSPSGRWFAFTTRDAAYVARIEPAPPRLLAALPSAALGAAPSVLSFSPDEAFLAVGAANTLGLIDLEAGSASLSVLSPSAVFDEFCSERFVDGARDWCGSASRELDVSWSSASDLVAFRSSLGTLQVIDLGAAREGAIGAPVSPDACFEGCSSSASARFQP